MAKPWLIVDPLDTFNNQSEDRRKYWETTTIEIRNPTDIEINTRQLYNSIVVCIGWQDNLY